MIKQQTLKWLRSDEVAYRKCTDSEDIAQASRCSAYDQLYKLAKSSKYSTHATSPQEKVLCMSLRGHWPSDDVGMVECAFWTGRDP
jgi:hypothetical protein